MAMPGELTFAQAPPPMRFPESEQVPETKQHFRLRTLLYEVLALAFGDHATIGSDQFMYWDPTEPKACLAPDAFVRLGAPDHLFRSWKVWENGAPQLAIEVISASDERDLAWDDKLQRYRRLGVLELIRFDPEAAEPTRMLRIWDAVEGDLVEREINGSATPSRVLPGHWLIAQDATLGPALRLSRDALGASLYLTPTERMHQLEAELSRRGE